MDCLEDRAVPSSLFVNAANAGQAVQDGQSWATAFAYLTDALATAGDYSATIAWGDGQTSPGTVTGSAGSFAVTGSHLYTEDGSEPVSVTINDRVNAASTATVTGLASVAEAAITATGSFTLTATEAVASAGQTVATFTDPNGFAAAGDYSATI